MRKLVVLAALGGAVLTLGACADSVLMPDGRGAAGRTAASPMQDQQVAGCVTDGVCPIGPIVVTPGAPECDPWMSVDWCGGNCISSTFQPQPEDGSSVQSCPGEGGGVPGGGGGGAPPPGGGTGPTPEPADTCRTGNQAIDSPAVQAALRDLWRRSGASGPQAQRLEHALWIIRHPDGTYGTAAFAYTVQEPCRVNGNMNAPPGAVGWVHTHPFTAGEEMQVCGPLRRESSSGGLVDVRGPNGQPLYFRYSNQPSQPDRDFMRAVNGVRTALGQTKIEGFMIDNEAIVVYSSNGTKDQPHLRCGY